MTESNENWTTTPLGRLLVNRLHRFLNPVLPPDPWPEELDRAVRADDAVEVCHHCFTPLTPFHWFCPDCGASVGRYNNWSPYLRIFALGEVLRSGVGHTARFTPLTTFGYLAFGLTEYAVLAPFYWLRLLIAWHRNGKQTDEAPAGSGEAMPGGDEEL